MKYFTITCKRGHCGVKQYYPITFAIEAETLLEACDLAKMMPGVKHNGNTILKCEEISYEEYVDLRKASAYDRNGFNQQEELYNEGTGSNLGEKQPNFG